MNNSSINKLTILSVVYICEDRSVTCEILYKHPFDSRVHKAKGKTKCHPDDTFDEEKGRRIAESRAKINLYKSYKEDLLELSEDIFDLRYKYFNLAKRELKHLSNIIHNGESM